MKRSFLTISLLTFFALAGSAQAAQVYGVNYGGIDKIVGFNHGSGPTSALPGSPWDVAGGSGGLYAFSISRDGTRGVAAFGFSGNALVGTRLAPDGSVTGAARVSGPGQNTVAISPVNDFVYGGNSGNGVAAAVQAADGGLTAVPGSPFSTGLPTGDLAISTNGKFLFASGGSQIHRFAIADNGAPNFIGSIASVGAQFLQVTPNGKHLLVLRVGGGDRLSSYSIGADGSLSEVGTPYEIGDSSSGEFAIDKTSTLAVIPNSNLDKLVYVKIGADGAVSSAGDSDSEDVETATFSPDGNLYLQRTSGGSGLYFAARTGPASFGPATEVFPVNWYQHARLTIRPTQGGVAQLRVLPQSKPLTFSLDGTASTGAGFEWNLGALGTRTTAVAKTEFTVGQAGSYPVSLTALDSNGCGADLIYTGQSATCTGSSAARASLTIDTPPWITSLSVSPSKVKSTTKIKFKLTEAASVSFYAQKSAKGRLVGTSCKKQTSKNKKAKKCTRWVRASATFRKSGKVGKTNSIKFTGKVGKKKIAPGSYRLYAVATDSAKGKGPAKTANFKIKKAKKKK